MKKRVFVYVRVSTREQAQEGYSLGEQEDRLKKYCEAMEWSVVKVFKDPGYTGSNMERPALQEMIKEIKKGKADIVLVDKLDRLSRSQFDTLYLIKKIFTENDCAFVSRAEAFDTSTPFGRAMVGILAVFAELERERIKERMADGKEGRAKDGLFRGGGNVPIGYDYTPKTDILTVNEYEAMIVNEIFKLFNERVPLETIAKQLNKKGYRTKYGELNAQAFRILLRNPVYIGKIQYKDNVYDGKHEAIVDVNVFNRAQDILKERDRTNAKYKPGMRYKTPLGGLLWCSHCGGKYIWRHNGKNKDGSVRAYYICYSRCKCDKKMIKDPNCRNKNYRDHVLENIVYNEVMKLKTDESYFNDLRESVDNSAERIGLERRIEQINNQISKFMDLYSISGMDFSVVKEKIEELQEEKAKLEINIDILLQEENKVPKSEVLDLVDTFNKVRAAGDSYAVHDVLVELIDHIELDGEDIRINWRF